MWLLGDVVPPVGQRKDPTGWLFTLALKHVRPAAKLRKPEVAWDNLVKLSRDYVALVDVERYDNWQRMDVYPGELIPTLVEALGWHQLRSQVQVADQGGSIGRHGTIPAGLRRQLFCHAEAAGETRDAPSRRKKNPELPSIDAGSRISKVTVSPLTYGPLSDVHLSQGILLALFWGKLGTSVPNERDAKILGDLAKDVNSVGRSLEKFVGQGPGQYRDVRVALMALSMARHGAARRRRSAERRCLDSS
jgi:hypothetical protein